MGFWQDLQKMAGYKGPGFFEQSVEKTVIASTAGKYCELIEPHFETSYGNEATCGDVALVKQFLIIFY